MGNGSFIWLLRRDLRYYRQPMLMVVAAIALAVAAITGALLTGGSVKQSLFALLDQRLGQAATAVTVPQRTVRQDLLAGIGQAAPILQLNAYASLPGRPAGSSKLSLHGVNEAFFRLAPDPQAMAAIQPEQLWLNPAAATQLKAKPGDVVVLRVRKPSALSGDFMMASPAKEMISLRMTVAGIIPVAAFGDFSTENNQRQSPSGFVNLEWLAAKVEAAGRANLFVSAERDGEKLRREVLSKLTLADLQCSVVEFPGVDTPMIRSASGFIPGEVVRAVGPDGCTPAFTWFANAIVANGRETPFSFVAGVAGLPLSDNEMAVSAWLAEDLGVKPGDPVTLRYFVVGIGPNLVEKQAEFKVGAVLPPPRRESLPVQRALMPDFPSLAGAENCSDWDADLPIDLKKVRKKDEAYWDDYRGTPKAFVSLKRARELWGSRFGDTTTLLIDQAKAGHLQADLQKTLAASPGLPGLQILELRKTGETAAANSVDFSGLFIGLSFFFIAAALILTGLMLAFFLDTRKADIGIFRAVGFPDRLIHRFFQLETSLLAIPGTVVGIFLGILWCQLILWSLNGIWIGAVGSTTLTLHLSPSMLGLAAVISLVLAWLLTTLVTRRFLKREIRELTDGAAMPVLVPAEKTGLRLVSTLLVLAGTAGAFLVPLEGDDAMGGFIGIGMVLLLGISGWLATFLYRLPGQATAATLTVTSAALRNLCRRRNRSLAVIILLALGVFLTVAVGINQKGTIKNPFNRQAGTGGFGLYLETALPLHLDLNAEPVRKKLGLADPLRLVHFRVAPGSSADCQNLNQVLIPRIIACAPESLAERQAFTFKKNLPCPSASPWNLLQADDDGTIPVVADMNALLWIMKKQVGQTIDYPVDGRTVKLKIVGGIENSVLQGNVIMSEKAFMKLFPAAGGYQLFLADAAPERLESLASGLARSLGTYGVSVETTGDRLNRINLVQNTYLKIFLALGGLGVLLGVLGTALLMLRNLRERRAEFAWMKAAGFNLGVLTRMLLVENLFLIVAGVATGTLAAALVMIPVLRSPTGDVPWLSLAIFYLGLCGGIFLFSLAISRRALRESSLADLAEE
jgi:ABC-type antimicrobial peptide transport system permease subunit